MKKSIVGTFVLALTLLTPQAFAGSGSGKASWYGPGFENKPTKSGEIFKSHLMTTASNSHKMGTRLKVTNPKNGKSVIVKVNDTGGFKKYGRTLDLSKGAFQKIASLNQGVINVTYEVVR